MIKNRVMKYLLAFFFLTVSYVAANGQAIKADNTAKYLSSGRYSWTVFIVADPAVVSKISSVQYTLHPTFQIPVRKVTNPKGTYPFALTETGWGEFTIGVKVLFKDNRTAIFTYPLKLLSKTKKVK